MSLGEEVVQLVIRRGSGSFCVKKANVLLFKKGLRNSFLFSTMAIDSYITRFRKCIYILISQLSTSTNLMNQCTLNSEVYITLHSNPR